LQRGREKEINSKTQLVFSLPKPKFLALISTSTSSFYHFNKCTQEKRHPKNDIEDEKIIN
jgi:hypothetical protein